MCILFIYTNCNPALGCYRLILATNRDEYFVRPAEPAHSWPDIPTIVSGMDMEPGREGGTWLGANIKPDSNFDMRLGVLLNVTGEARHPRAAGRGFIVTDFLKSVNETPEEYITLLKSAGATYNAYNFVAVELANNTVQTIHYSNVSNQTIKYGSNIVQGFGNSLPEDPYVKVTSGTERFVELIDKYNKSPKEVLITGLIEFLKWDKRHLPDKELERRAPDAAEHLSSIFVKIQQAGYGTRTHSIILVDFDGNVDFIEDTMECPIDIHNPKWIKHQIQAHL